jgi:hypothetical protein
LDVTLKIIEVYLSIFERLFGSFTTLREQSFLIHGHQLWKTNLRLHNLPLESLTTGDSGFCERVAIKSKENLESIFKKVKQVIEHVRIL